MNPPVDSHGRTARYMRVSLTDACNYRCGFCVPPGQPAGRGKARDRLTCADMLRLCGIFASLGVDRFKITGGEPFLNPDALPFIRGLKNKPGTAGLAVTVTTNGSTLDQYAAALAGTGVDGVNVSVNAMTQTGYERVTGTAHSLQHVLDNILLAREAGLRVKLNMVPLRGMNEDDILPLLDFALPRGIPVRFIELMPIGRGKQYEGLTSGEIRTRIESRFGKASAIGNNAERPGNGPAVYLSLPGFSAGIGFIAPLSRRFCASCDRIRLNSAGFLRTCLHHGHGADLSPLLRQGESDDRIAARIRETVAAKPDGHHFENHLDENSGAGDEPMHRIGG